MLDLGMPLDDFPPSLTSFYVALLFFGFIRR
jgi:hypothetical protein